MLQQVRVEIEASSPSCLLNVYVEYPGPIT